MFAPPTAIYTHGLGLSRFWLSCSGRLVYQLPKTFKLFGFKNVLTMSVLDVYATILSVCSVWASKYIGNGQSYVESNENNRTFFSPRIQSKKCIQICL